MTSQPNQKSLQPDAATAHADLDTAHHWLRRWGRSGGHPARVHAGAQGYDVMLLESHQDFERDFRGDRLHASILQIMDELGLADQRLQLPHTKLSELSAPTPHGLVKIADLRHQKTKFPFVAMLPQSRFLDFMTREAEGFPSFRLVMGARVEELQETDHAVCGVRYRSEDGGHAVQSLLTVGADGRFSRVRKLSGLGDSAIKASAPIDVLWFRLPRQDGGTNGLMGCFGPAHLLIELERRAA